MYPLKGIFVGLYTHWTRVSAKENTLIDNYISLTLKSCLFLPFFDQSRRLGGFQLYGEAPRIPLVSPHPQLSKLSSS